MLQQQLKLFWFSLLFFLMMMLMALCVADALLERVSEFSSI